MPSDNFDQDRDRDREDKPSKSKQPAAASKTKDLSHVPCKFFKVGGCTAGSSCPFSHSSSAEPGQKETCTWFVKGNCKFGHKCALAHILPGQSPAMDRKNKKAAQAAAAGTAPGADKPKSSSSGRKRESASDSARLPLAASSRSSATGSRPLGVPLKASISPSAPAPPLKDTDFAAFANLDEMDGIHQQARPTDSDTSTTPETTTSAQPAPLPPSAPRAPHTAAPADFGPIGSPPNYRQSQPTSPTRPAFSPGTSPRSTTHINGVNINTTHNTASPAPQGTPSAAILSSSPFSAPGTQTSFLTGSYSTGGGYANMGMAASLGSGLAMMGGGRKGWGDADAAASPARQPGSFSGLLSAQLASSLSNSSAARPANGYTTGEYDINVEYDDFGGTGRRRSVREAVEDEEMEDFLPSSLTELLTPEERSRRMSRSHSGGVSQLSRELAGTAAAADAGPAANPNGAQAPVASAAPSAMGHRYSRSVPAPTLLGDIKSIWADANSAMPASPGTRGAFSAAPRYDSYGNALPGGGPGAFADADGLSMSIGSAGAGGSSYGVMNNLSPSNASAAFLPGLHHHYLNNKAKQQQQQSAQQQQLGLGGIGRTLRTASGPLYGTASGTGSGVGNSLAGNYMGMPASVSSAGFHTHTHGGMQTTYRATPSPFDLTQSLHQGAGAQGQLSGLSQAQLPYGQQTQTQQQYGLTATMQAPPRTGGGGGAFGGDADAQGGILSPSTRALQAHAPGQSLPQGLAAGYSRIHALPPLTHLALSPPAGGGGEEGYGADWGVGSAPKQAQQGQGVAGLETMFSRLSYSAAAARGGTPPTASGLATAAAAGAGAGAGTPPPAPPPGLSRNVSGGRYGAGLLSPLSGPVMTKDDDDLFDMESG